MMYYGAWYNLAGLGEDKPVKLRYDDGNEWGTDPCYWVDEGECKDDFSFKDLGLHVKGRCVTFASINIEEVEAFISGVKAVGTLMNIPTLETE